MYAKIKYVCRLSNISGRYRSYDGNVIEERGTRGATARREGSRPTSGTKEKKPKTKPEGGAALPWLFPAGNF